MFLPALDPDVPSHQLNPDEQPIVRAVARRDEGVELLRVIQVELALAAAELAWLDDHRCDFEDDDLLARGRAITRQVRALRRLADLEVSRVRRFGRPDVRLDDPRVVRLMGLLLERVIDIGSDVLPAENAERFETTLRQRLAAEPLVPCPWGG
jgi:hypothetical protein